jgi:tryptophanyl-tRNA synthetase
MTNTTQKTADPRDAEPVPDGSRLMAFLHVLRKAHRKMVGEIKARQRFAKIVTCGEARQYIEEVMPQLLREREKRRQQRLHAHRNRPRP